MTSRPGRMLALDIGDVRTGIAVSDELGFTARPLETVATANLAERLTELVGEYAVETVLVGRPRSLDGSLGQQAEKIATVVETLFASLSVEFLYEDETGTTLAANSLGTGSDAEAAAVLLSGHLRGRVT